jgi:dethiobiotin synthase
MNIFVTGTDTDVGKTVVSAWLCLHTNADYWKPIQTRNDSDKNVVAKLSPRTRIIPEIYKLKAPLSPYDASKLEDIEIDRNLFRIDTHNTVIEGAGGILGPVAKNFLMVDLIKTCGAKVLIVAKSKLGMINHLLMTTEVLRSRAIDILGIVINGKIENNLKNTIEGFSKLKILSVIPQSADLVRMLQNKAFPLEFLEMLK